MLEESVYTDSLIFIKKYDIIYIERKEKRKKVMINIKEMLSEADIKKIDDY